MFATRSERLVFFAGFTAAVLTGRFFLDRVLLATISFLGSIFLGSFLCNFFLLYWFFDFLLYRLFAVFFSWRLLSEITTPDDG